MRFISLVLSLILASVFIDPVCAAPDSASVELGWRKNFSGAVTALGKGHITLQLDNSEKSLVFDIVLQTEAVPSESAVKVGSKVRIVATDRKLIRVEVVPYGEWLKSQPSP